MASGSFDPQAPLVISGVGGSGTRVVSEMLIRLGYYLGQGNNSAHDNLWFRYLLKRPDWYKRCLTSNPGELERVLTLFTDIMTGGFRPTPANLGPALKATGEQGWRGIKRFARLLGAHRPNPSLYVGWGWKEPSAHVYLESLFRHFPRMKYIHTIRHGLDMAFTGKLSQIRDWASWFDLPSDVPDHNLPVVLLEFWIRANQRALQLGRTIGPEKFYLLDFEKLCLNPKVETDKLITFLGISPSPEAVAQAAAFPRPPKSQKRYLAHDLGVLEPRQLKAVADMGFPIEQKGPAP